MSTSKTIAASLLAAGACRVSLDPLFTWTSGITSPFYCDLRSLNSNVEVRRQITDAFVSMINPDDVDVIAGTATAGISWAAWVAEKLDKPMVYVRSKSKEHGTRKRVEGVVKAGQKVLVIEDLITTGGSSIRTVEALREDCGANVTDICAINTYEIPVAQASFEGLGVRMQTITTFSEILDAAMERGDISDEQVAILKEFGEDPAGWAERHGYK